VATRAASKDGLGHYGYAYLDLPSDTGATRVPWLSHLSGGTGAWGDPRWEVLADPTEDFLIFPSVEPDWCIEDTLDQAWLAKDILFITPLAAPLRRPAVGATPTAQRIALEHVLTAMRRQAGMPVGDLAHMLGVSRRQFYNWLARENHPDIRQEARIRGAARLVARVHDHYRDPRMVRAAFLATTEHGSAFEALSDGRLAQAANAIEAVLAAPAAPRTRVAPSQHVDVDRDRVELELLHLRDRPRREDDRPD
jgi:hypothetical protein